MVRNNSTNFKHQYLEKARAMPTNLQIIKKLIECPSKKVNVTQCLLSRFSGYCCSKKVGITTHTSGTESKRVKNSFHSQYI